MRHIKHSHQNRDHKTWCGAPIQPFDWLFQDIDHAVYSIMQGSLIDVCDDCLDAIIEVIRPAEKE